MKAVLKALAAAFCLSAVQSDRTTFDCKMRQLAMDFAHFIQPHLQKEHVSEIAEALDTDDCYVTPPNAIVQQLPEPMVADSSSVHRVFVGKWRDVHKYQLFDGLDTALKWLRTNVPLETRKEVILAPHIHYLKNGPIQLSKADSNTAIRGGNADELNAFAFASDTQDVNAAPTVSAGVRLSECRWRLHKETEDRRGIWKTDLTAIASSFGNRIPGLRLNGSRAIRARFPNANPEEGFGSELRAISWLKPSSSRPKVTIKPDTPTRHGYATDQFDHFQIGVAGVCNNFEPNAGYWCGNATQGEESATYRVPSGLVYDGSILPNSPYADVTGAIAHVWHPQKWATWKFELDNQHSDSGKLVFKKGGFQEARGADYGGAFYVENVFEELDARGEWFYNESTHTLYFYNNITSRGLPPPSCEFFDYTVTHEHVVFNIDGAENVSLARMFIVDTAITYMEAHSMPSGGDWAMHKKAAVTIADSTNINVTQTRYLRCDGKGILVYGRNRDVNLRHNHFLSQGETCIAFWGLTHTPADDPFYGVIPDGMGYDGTAMDVPKNCHANANYAWAFGIWQKQSALVFLAKSTFVTVTKNIAHSMPRGGIVFNDGFGGGNVVCHNLLFDSCQESGDHGVVNTWDRQLYQFVNSSGAVTVLKEYDTLRHNFLIGETEKTQHVIDTNDGSAYFKEMHNLLVYAPNGMKSKNGGHSIEAVSNIYAYVEVHSRDSLTPTCFHVFDSKKLPGFNDVFFNNTCVLNANNVPYGKFNCKSRTQMWPILGYNKIYTGKGSALLCGLTVAEFQKTFGYDLNTTVNVLPTDEKLLSAAKAMLFVDTSIEYN